MGAAGEKVGGLGALEGIASLGQQRHIPGQGGRVAGHIHDSPGGKPNQRLDGIGIQTLPRGVHHYHVRLHALLFQRQRRLARIAAEKFRIFDAVAPGVLPGIRHGLLHHLHTDDFACRGGHGQRDGANTAIKIQHRVGFGDLRLLNGGLIQSLGLVVVDLVKRSG